MPNLPGDGGLGGLAPQTAMSDRTLAGSLTKLYHKMLILAAHNLLL